MTQQVEELKEELEITKSEQDANSSLTGFDQKIGQQNSELRQTLKQASSERDTYLSELKEMKSSLATSELERDTLSNKLRQKNKQIATFTEDITRKEAELVQKNQQLGEALNEAFDMEQEICRLHTMLPKS